MVKPQVCYTSPLITLYLYFDGSSWEQHDAGHSQQLLDILHVSHMWEIQPGIDFAAEQLLLPQFKLHPAQRLYIARRYGLLNWISSPIRELLASSFEKYAQDSENQLGFNLYVIIATAKESIATERKRLGNHSPFPQNFDDGPFCIGAQHETCKRVWAEKWFFQVVRRIHHPTTPIALSMVPQLLEEMEHRGMNPECKEFLITWLKQSSHIQKEEDLIEETIDKVRNLFM